MAKRNQGGEGATACHGKERLFGFRPRSQLPVRCRSFAQLRVLWAYEHHAHARIYA